MEFAAAACDNSRRGRNICIERKWDSIEEELEDKQKTYVRENDPWNKLRMYVDMVLSRPKRTRLALCDVCGAYEYMDESAVVALPSAMDAVYSLITQSVVLEKIFALLGGLTPVPAADGRNVQWLRARRGFRARMASLMKLLKDK